MSDATPVKAEPCPKRVRVYLGGKLVADTTNSLLVWETPHYPTYYFPMGDLRMVDFKPSRERRQSPVHGNACCFDVPGGTKVALGGAWQYPDSPLPGLRQHVRFDWAQMDAWFEEEEEVFVHAHDPHKRIDILHSARHIEVAIDGTKLADTRRPTIVYETGAPIRFYIPKPDIRMDLLQPTELRTGCAYKGFARYWSVRIGDAGHENVAWSYAAPIADCAKIAGLVAFYNERVDIVVDSAAQPRPRSDRV